MIGGRVGWSASAGTLSEIGNFAFTGQEYDSETGLYCYGARYYDPNIGRFISADTKIDGPFDTQGYGRYTHCRNNPIKYSDPTGHGVIDWGIIKIAWGDDAKGGFDLMVGIDGLAAVRIRNNSTDGFYCKAYIKNNFEIMVYYKDKEHWGFQVEKTFEIDTFSPSNGDNNGNGGGGSGDSDKNGGNGGGSGGNGNGGNNSGGNNNTPPNEPTTQTPGSTAENTPRSVVPFTVKDSAPDPNVLNQRINDLQNQINSLSQSDPYCNLALGKNLLERGITRIGNVDLLSPANNYPTATAMVDALNVLADRGEVTRIGANDTFGYGAYNQAVDAMHNGQTVIVGGLKTDMKEADGTQATNSHVDLGTLSTPHMMHNPQDWREETFQVISATGFTTQPERGNRDVTIDYSFGTRNVNSGAVKYYILP